MSVLGYAESDVENVLENQTRSALCRCASDASPIVLSVAAEEIVVDDQKRSLALALDVLKGACVFNWNDKTIDIR